MSADLHRIRRFVAFVAFAAAFPAVVSIGRAEDTPIEASKKAAASAPAMQGHDAEARLREPDAEARWRRLFFDAAGREEGEPQVACDHRARRRPDVIGGPAAVAILWDPASGRVLVRRWESGEAAIDLEPLRRRLGEAAPAGTRVEALAFLRCR